MTVISGQVMKYFMDLISISCLVLRHLLERHSRLHCGVSGVHEHHDLLPLSQEFDGLVITDVVHLLGNHMVHESNLI